MTATKTKPLTYTVEQAAQLLGIGRNSCYEGCASGEIPSVRIGKRLLVPRAALEKFLDINPRCERAA
jgi:excisionase family DNA binding protein